MYGLRTFTLPIQEVPRVSVQLNVNNGLTSLTNTLRQRTSHADRLFVARASATLQMSYQDARRRSDVRSQAGSNGLCA